MMNHVRRFAEGARERIAFYWLMARGCFFVIRHLWGIVACFYGLIVVFRWVQESEFVQRILREEEVSGKERKVRQSPAESQSGQRSAGPGDE